jgi:phage-related protein
MPNQVTLTFAGDTKSIEDGFARAGGAAKSAGRDVEEAGRGFSKAGEAADEVDTKAMGFRDTLTGVQDTAKGTSLIMKGDLFNGFLTLGAGIGDLGSGFYNLIIPALEKTKIATVAQSVASKAAAVATNIWTGAQRLLSLAFISSPIGWIVLGIAALVAVVVLIATKTTWFQTIWRVAWGGIKTAASNVWDWLKALPGKIGNAFGRIGSTISAPFKAAFNLIASAWNNTVGRLSFTVPGWVPGLGGKGWSAPQLPHFHAGGVVPGVKGSPQVALLQGGERVTQSGGGGGGTTVFINDGLFRELIVQAVAAAVGQRGGDPATLNIRLG